MADDSALKTEFDRFDTDHNGSIDEGEFAALLRALGVRMSPEHVSTAFLAIDVNGNSRIDFGEFKAWWTRRKA
jgi:calcium-binding protein CML